MIKSKGNKKPDGRVTLSRAADAIGVKPATLRSWCRLKNVGTKITDEFNRSAYFLTETEVERLKHPENRPQMGRPKKSGKS